MEKSSLSPAVKAFLAPLTGTRPECLRMIAVPSIELTSELRELEGVHISADVGACIEDCEIIDGEMFDECFDAGVWISPHSGMEVPAERVTLWADLDEAASHGLHGLGHDQDMQPGLDA